MPRDSELETFDTSFPYVEKRRFFTMFVALLRILVAKQNLPFFAREHFHVSGKSN